MRKVAPLKDSLLMGQLEWYLDQHYIFRTEKRYRGILGFLRAKLEREKYEEREKEIGREHNWTPNIYASDPHTYNKLLQEFLKNHETDNFSKNLMQLIESKGLDHVEVYKKARIDRKLFSKIRSNKDYIPSKKTVLALALAMELNQEETNKLLEAGGYSLSEYILFDLIVEFFIVQKIYDIDTINSALFRYKQQIF